MSTNGEDDFLYKGILDSNMGALFNNPEFSDTTFIVRKSKLYAWSGLLSVASTPLRALIANYDDGEINLHNVKHVESFSILLKAIYGLTINFTGTDVAVLCEALTLADHYKLTHFFGVLKSYLCDLDGFSVGTAVVLLNTAYKFKITDLYARVTLFACGNSDHLMKHESFPGLQYSVLVDLLKSNWFCSPEIDILMGILNWHTDMDQESKNGKRLAKENDEDETVDKESKSVKALAEENGEEGTSDSESEPVETLGKENDGYETISVLFNNELTVDETENHNVTDDLGEDLDGETSDAKKTDPVSKVKKGCLSKGKASSSTASNTNHVESEKRGKQRVDIVPVFSENVLKSLLALVRIPKISAQEWLAASGTELFKKYEHLLLNASHFSPSQESRGNYEAVTVMPTACTKEAKKKFTMEGPFDDMEVIYESEEEHVFGTFKWKVGLSFTDWMPGRKVQSHKRALFTTYLICTPCIASKPASGSATTAAAVWEATADCQLKLMSRSPHTGHIVLPNDESHATRKFTNANACVEIGTFEWEGPSSKEWANTYRPNETYSFEVEVKCRKP